MASWQTGEEVAGVDAWALLDADEGTAKERLAIMHFNLGAELCLLGRATEALAELSRAIELDVACADTALADDAWSALWNDPRFTELLFCEDAPMAQRTPTFSLN
jgi:hypothetical protein